MAVGGATAAISSRYLPTLVMILATAKRCQLAIFLCIELWSWGDNRRFILHCAGRRFHDISRARSNRHFPLPLGVFGGLTWLLWLLERLEVGVSRPRKAGLDCDLGVDLHQTAKNAEASPLWNSSRIVLH